MRPQLVLLLTACLTLTAATLSDKPDTPFKLATFETQGKTRIGMVLADRILDLAGANAWVTKSANLAPAKIPNEMRALIEQYDTLSKRMYQIANYVKDKKLDGQPFVFPLDKVSIKAPIKYPWNLLNMAANYWSHAREMGVNNEVDPDRDAP